MHKPNQPQAVDNDHGKIYDPLLEGIMNSMEHPSFTPEQLPELWQLVTETEPGRRGRIKRWNHEIGEMCQRCDTYPQYAQLCTVLSGTHSSVWSNTWEIAAHGDDLLSRATTEHLIEALRYEQKHPGGWWKASDHIRLRAGTEQLTGPVIAEFAWTEQFRKYANVHADRAIGLQHNTDGNTAHVLNRTRHALELVRQHLLAGDNNAWKIFLGIVDKGTLIGDTAKLANAIERRNSPTHH